MTIEIELTTIGEHVLLWHRIDGYIIHVGEVIP